MSAFAGLLGFAGGTLIGLAVYDGTRRQKVLVVVGLILLAIGASVSRADCPPEGDATTATEREQNPLKNRAAIPETVNDAITIETILAPGDDRDRFKQTDAATIIGYVAEVKDGGLESCNCHDPALLDTHIALVADEDDADDKSKSVIVEVTPRMRDTMTALGVDWSTAAIKRDYLHHWVAVTGWLFWDGSHVENATNTHPDGDKNWRASCTEIHPVTNIVPLLTTTDTERNKTASLEVRP